MLAGADMQGYGDEEAAACSNSAAAEEAGASEGDAGQGGRRSTGGDGGGVHVSPPAPRRLPPWPQSALERLLRQLAAAAAEAHAAHGGRGEPWRWEAEVPPQAAGSGGGRKPP